MRVQRGALARGARFEDVAGGWLKELLGIPAKASVGFTTGGQGANTVGLAAGRWKVLEQVGWDVGRDGLGGAPRVSVVASAERHATIDRSLRLLGLGENAIEEIPALANGAMDTDALLRVLRSQPDTPTIVCAQAGNVNTGACDDLDRRGDRGCQRRSLGSRRWCVRALGGRQPGDEASRRRHRSARIRGPVTGTSG